MQLRKRTSKVSSLEGQLDRKSHEVTDQVSKVNQVESELAENEVHMSELQNQISALSEEVSRKKLVIDNMQKLHTEQCTEMESNIELVNL